MSSDENNETYGDSARGPDVAPAGDGADDERRLMSRRALIRAGWALPAILAVKLPTDAFAQYAHGDQGVLPHSDGPDLEHWDMVPRGTFHVDDSF